MTDTGVHIWARNQALAMDRESLLVLVIDWERLGLGKEQRDALLDMLKPEELIRVVEAWHKGMDGLHAVFSSK